MEHDVEDRTERSAGANWFRDKLTELDITQSDLARLLITYGDDRAFDAILRSFRRMASGDARVSGEMRTWLTFAARERAANLKLAESLERRITLFEAGTLKLTQNGTDVSAEALAETVRERQELRELPVPFRV